jgi:hypothetical protein
VSPARRLQTFEVGVVPLLDRRAGPGYREPVAAFLAQR